MNLLEMQCNVVETITEEICVESPTAYRNDQPDGLRESCAEDERRAEKPERTLHLREDREGPQPQNKREHSDHQQRFRRTCHEQSLH